MCKRSELLFWFCASDSERKKSPLHITCYIVAICTIPLVPPDVSLRDCAIWLKLVKYFADMNNVCIFATC